MLCFRGSIIKFQPLLHRRNVSIRSGFCCTSRTVKLRINRNMSSASQLDLSGILPPIPTPFDENENIRYDFLEDNLNKWHRFPFREYSTG